MRLEDYIPKATSGNGAEETEEQRDKSDEARVAAALAGRITDSDNRNADRYRSVVERRVASCMRVAGCTLARLKDNDPARYRRFLRGCSRAIRREAAFADGTLSGAEVAALRRRFNQQADIDRIAEEFQDFIDDRSEEMYP
jgi:hypothetical protein